MKNNSLAMLLTAIIAMLIIMSTQAKQGAFNGIKLCSQIIVPSLLPVLIITNIIIRSKCSSLFNTLFGWITKILFKLPRQSASAIIFGLIGGYPAGAILTSQLVKTDALDSLSAKRIMRFNFCGGLAFIITAVGTICLGNAKYGVILYASCTASSILIGFINSIFCKSKPIEKSNDITLLNFSDAMIEAVDASSNSIITMCAYIIMFSALMNIIKLPAFVTPLIEITNGICGNTAFFSLPMIAAFLSFGGICIHFQLIEFLKAIGISYLDFLISRIIGALLSYGITYLILLLFPQAQPVFSNLTTSISASATQVNAGLSTIMVLGCAVLIFDIENKKLKLS